MRRDDARRQGMTLIEVMIVIMIIAVVAGGLTMGIGAINRSKLRGSCMTIGAAARFAFHRAVSQGNTVRIRLDFTENAVSLEEAHGAMTINRNPEEDETEEDDAVVDPWAAAAARLDGTLGANLGRSAFGPITDEDGDAIDRFTPRPLENVAIVQLFTPHEPEPRTSGVGYIYFFPGGRAEGAVVQLADADEHVYTVSLHPLTGRPTIVPYAEEPEDIEDEDLRDPG